MHGKNVSCFIPREDFIVITHACVKSFVCGFINMVYSKQRLVGDNAWNFLYVL